jgi:flagellar hook-associated protein 1 FlgK
VPSIQSLNAVRTGLTAARKALDVVGQNVANASTIGYSRQEVSYAAAPPSAMAQGGGRGIENVTVLRYRDQFLDRQYRQHFGSQGYQETKSHSLSQVEQVFGGLSEDGLSASLDRFFSAWDHLANSPSSAATRPMVIGAAQEFIGVAQSTYGEMLQLRTDIDSTLQSKVKEINTITAELADLNLQIKGSPENESEGHALRDRRDYLLDGLAKLAGVTSNTMSDGSATVYLGSLPLVEDTAARPLDLTTAVELTPPGQAVTTVTWNGTGTAANFPPSEMKALLEMRDQAIPRYMQELDNLVRTVAAEVNTLHTTDAFGLPLPPPDNNPIFTIGPNWMQIDLDPAVIANPALILAAATLPAASGDGDRARQIAGLRNAQFVTGGIAGVNQLEPGDYLRAVAQELGLQIQQAQRRSDAATLQVTQVDKQRQSVAGVSLDDEMTKMVQFQQAYNASARVITVIDEMLDVVVNRLGTAGR